MPFAQVGCTSVRGSRSLRTQPVRLKSFEMVQDPSHLASINPWPGPRTGIEVGDKVGVELSMPCLVVQHARIGQAFAAERGDCFGFDISHDGLSKPSGNPTRSVCWPQRLVASTWERGGILSIDRRRARPPTRRTVVDCKRPKPRWLAVPPYISRSTPSVVWAGSARTHDCAPGLVPLRIGRTLDSFRPGETSGTVRCSCGRRPASEKAYSGWPQRWLRSTLILCDRDPSSPDSSIDCRPR